jgi:hypothetical protein
VIPYKEREVKLKRPSDFASPQGQTIQGCDAWYSYMINDWIPGQPDAGELMALFIACDFQPLPFIEKLTGKQIDSFSKGEKGDE